MDADLTVDCSYGAKTQRLVAYEYARYISAIEPMMRTFLSSCLDTLIADVIDLVTAYAMMATNEHYREVWWNPIRNDGFRDAFTESPFTLRVGDFDDASSSVQLELWIENVRSKDNRTRKNSHHIGIEVSIGATNEMLHMLGPLPISNLTDGVAAYLSRNRFEHKIGGLLMTAFSSKANHLLEILAAELGY